MGMVFVVCYEFKFSNFVSKAGWMDCFINIYCDFSSIIEYMFCIVFFVFRPFALLFENVCAVFSIWFKFMLFCKPMRAGHNCMHYTNKKIHSFIYKKVHKMKLNWSCMVWCVCVLQKPQKGKVYITLGHMFHVKTKEKVQ